VIGDQRATKVMNGKTLAIHVYGGGAQMPIAGLIATVDGDTVFTVNYGWLPRAGGWVLARQQITMRQNGRIVGSADLTVDSVQVKTPSQFAKAGIAISSMIGAVVLPDEVGAQSACFFTYMETVFIVLGWAALSLTPAGIVAGLLGMGASGLAVLKTFHDCAVQED
jgi:hypothetical protein